MDTIDVGGAAVGGRPVMPPVSTVDESGAPVDDGQYKEPVPEQPKAEPSVKVQKAVESTPMGGAHAAYPEDHPANREDIEQTSDGGLKLTRDNETRSFDMHKPLGDVQQGYVTGRRDDPRNSGGEPAATPDIDQTMASLKAEMAVAEAAMELDQPAHNEAGEPLIEVLFHLPVGVIVSYHNHVVEQDRWLVFVDDNRQPAKQKFIPNPTGDPQPIDITITGADKVQQQRRIQPLGINFTLSNYDFFVTMVVPAEE